MLPILVEVKQDQPPGVAKRRTSEWQRAAFAEMGKFWFANYLGDHFTSYAKVKYHYQRRSRGYLKRKAALARVGKAKEGGLVDLVLSGDMRMVMRSAMEQRAYPTRVSVVMQCPFYMSFRPRGNQPDKQREVLTTIDSQNARLEKVWAEKYEKQLATFKAPETVKIGG